MPLDPKLTLFGYMKTLVNKSDVKLISGLLVAAQIAIATNWGGDRPSFCK